MIADVKAAIGRAWWDINYHEFCRRAGWREDDYADDKWQQWQALYHALSAFDSDTLDRIVEP